LTGTPSSPTLLTFEFPERQWSGSETVFEARALHLAASIGELDVYYAATGTAPVPGAARASIGFGELSPLFEPTAGDYELILTTHDDPGDILYRSREVTPGARSSLLYGVFDPDPSITGNLGVRVIGSGSAADLADVDSPPQVRVMHAAFSTGNTDMYLDDDFATPFVSDLAYGQITPYANFATAAVPVTFTPTGNTGVMLLEDTLTAVAGTRSTTYLIGAPAARDIVSVQDNARPVSTYARIRIAHLADNAEGVDMYVHLADQDIADITTPLFNVPFRSSTGYFNSSAGDYLLTVTLTGKKDPIAGPLPLDLALGDVVEIALLDTVDPALFDLVIYGN
jgi:hypothetical protein